VYSTGTTLAAREIYRDAPELEVVAGEDGAITLVRPSDDPRWPPTQVATLRPADAQ
jgi:hypothetical protein